MKKFRYLLFFGAICLLPIIGSACPMCQAGATKRTESAYLETTAILALIPVFGGGGIFFWFYSKGKKMKKEGD